MVRFLCFALTLAVALGAFTPARASVDCRLTRYATIDMRSDDPDRIELPVTINGHEEVLAVDTGAPLSVLNESVVAELGLPRHTMLGEMRFVQGARIRHTATVSDFEIGGMKGRNFRFGVLSDRLLEKGIAGLFGAEIVRNFDLDLDFAANKITLFSPHHCPRRVIYWTRDRYAAIPMHVNQGEKILIPVKLDGVRLLAAVDTGAPPAVVMSLNTARRVFGWHRDPPELHRIGTSNRYTYPFGKLSLGGANVRHPTVDLDAGEFHLAGADILVGLAALKAFHVYISYEDRMLYLTARDAH